MSYQPELIVYIRAHSWRCTVCEVCQMHNDRRPPLWFHTAAWKSLVLCLFIPPPHDHHQPGIFSLSLWKAKGLSLGCETGFSHLVIRMWGALRLFVVWQLIYFQHWVLLHHLDGPPFIHPLTAEEHLTASKFWPLWMNPVNVHVCVFMET